MSEPGARGSVAIAFGPVPSRRLGRSLGINNVPPKACSYSCVYCQVGRTARPESAPRDFGPAAEVIDAVASRVHTLRERGERVDVLTFVPDGEPTLDARLAEEIDGLRGLGLRIAVISNGSLCWREEVRAALGKADWVSLKVDTVDETTWRRLDRPEASLDLERVLDGMRRFAREFGGDLASETMLVCGLNDGADALVATAAFLAELGPQVAFIAVPTRPPAEPWVSPADEEAVNRAYHLFAERVPRVELLTGFEGTAFGSSGDAAEDLLAVTAVHPMREDAALALLARAGADRAVLERLLRVEALRRVTWGGHAFYVRRLPRIAVGEGADA